MFHIDNNNKCFLSIKQANESMISEGSCDTEDWNNDAGNVALHHTNKLDFKVYSNRKKLL